MKLFAFVIGALALLAGAAGGVQAYTASATTAPAPPPVAVSHRPTLQVARPDVVVKWAPCRAPAVRHGRACVTTVTRTVVVTTPAATAPSPAPVHAPQVASTRTLQPTAAPHEQEGSTDSGEHEGAEHEGAEHEGGEHDD